MNEQLKSLNMCESYSFMHALTDLLFFLFCFFTLLVFLLDVTMPFATS